MIRLRLESLHRRFLLAHCRPNLATLAFVAVGAAALPATAHANHSMSIATASVCRTFASITATSTATSSLGIPMTARVFPDGCFGTGIPGSAATFTAVGESQSFVVSFPPDTFPLGATVGVSISESELPGGDEGTCINAVVGECQDRFKCYQARTAGGGPRFARTTLALTDPFESKVTDLVKPALFCNPAEVNGVEVTDPSTYLECYRSKDARTTPRQEKFAFSQPLSVVNQFGLGFLELKKSEMTCLPSGRDAVPSSFSGESFKCYKAKVARKTPRFQRRGITLTDRELTTASELRKPVALCAPTAVESNPTFNLETHLACYMIRDAAKFPGKSLSSQNALGNENLLLRRPRLVCVPTQVWTDPVCGDGAVNRADEDCESGDDSRCPGSCDPTTCRCAAICGDDVADAPYEQCDGTDDSACPGSCVGCVCEVEGGIRLAGGAQPGQGRVEVFHSGQWGTVCSDFFDEDAAAVTCRQLGYSDGTAQCCAAYGQGSGPIWMDDVQCLGDESRLVECPFGGFGLHNCIHAEDVGVTCTP